MKNEKVAKGRIIGLAGPCFLVQHCLNHIESVSPFFINFDESITDGRTDRPTDQRTDPIIEMRGRI